MSNALCRLSTGGGLGTRKLYTNNEQQVFNVVRPLVLNGITDLAHRTDLGDHAIILELHPFRIEMERRAYLLERI